MIRLTLTEAKAFINSFNPRAEKNGEETRPAGDISVTVNSSADVLAEFAPALKSFLFDPNGLKDLADGSPLRFAEIPLIHWNDEMTGASFALNVGVGKPIEFTEAKVNKFTIEPIAGGAVKLSFRVQVHPDEKQFGRLSTLIQSEVSVSLTPAEMSELRDGEQ